MSNHQLNLHPTDVLFFKDGRPMEGSASGHGAAWPLPNVIDSALHAALHRSGLGDQAHKHTIGRSSEARDPNDPNLRTRNFGSLQSSGPFPVHSEGKWFFPRPADADLPATSQSNLRPLRRSPANSSSSLASGLLPVVNTSPPSKKKAERWLSADAYQAYLLHDPSPTGDHYLDDSEVFCAEHNIGIGIDASTGAQDGVRFYSASYLRLQPEWSLGLIASCLDKQAGDLIAETFPNSGQSSHILAGGQQRTCTVHRSQPETLPLPQGPQIQGKLLRWTLLTPTIFPRLEGNHEHPGGWLPTWISPDHLEVQLLDGPGKNAAKRRKVEPGKRIPATLIAARIPPPIPVTGWSLGKTGDRDFGAKSTHLAVPAGSVYYFECCDETSAKNLANALNWHGNTPGTHILNRRSSLLGEKGFGLGVCSTFTFHH